MAAARCRSRRRRESRPSSVGRFFYSGPAPGHPAPDRRLIPFARLRGRTLEGPVQGPKDSPDMAGMIRHAREPLDHGRDPRQGPEVRRKPVRAGALTERVLDARQLRRRQFRLPPRSPRTAQRGAPSPSPGLIPSTDALPAHLQRAGDAGHDLAGRKQVRRPSAAQFQGVEVSAWRHMCLHGPSIQQAPRNVTLFCEIH